MNSVINEEDPVHIQYEILRMGFSRVYRGKVQAYCEYLDFEEPKVRGVQPRRLNWWNVEDLDPHGPGVEEWLKTGHWKKADDDMVFSSEVQQ